MWMTEDYLTKLFEKTAPVISVKIIRDKQTKLPLGYGFVEFESHEVAAKVLDVLSGAMHPGTNKPFRLNWGIHSGAKARSGYGQSGDRNSRGGWGGRHDGNDRSQTSVSLLHSNDSLQIYITRLIYFSYFTIKFFSFKLFIPMD